MSVDLDALRAELEAVGAHVTTDAPVGVRAIQAHWPHDREPRLGNRIHATIEVDGDGGVTATRGYLHPAYLAIIARSLGHGPDAAVLTPEQAKLAAKALHSAAWASSMAAERGYERYRDGLASGRTDEIECNADAARYRALAEVLGAHKPDMVSAGQETG